MVKRCSNRKKSLCGARSPAYVDVIKLVVGRAPCPTTFFVSKKLFTEKGNKIDENLRN
jgi:hypothetical protein